MNLEEEALNKLSSMNYAELTDFLHRGLKENYKLRSALAIAVEALEIYAKKSNWEVHMNGRTIMHENFSPGEWPNWADKVCGPDNRSWSFAKEALAKIKHEK